MKKDITSVGKNQETIFLSDKKINGKERPWKDKKESGEYLSSSYGRLAMREDALTEAVKRDIKVVEALGDMDMRYQLDEDIFKREKYKIYWSKRSECTCGCATYLEFRVMLDGSKKLHNAHFCQVRLCPVCGWRRELKIKAQLSKVIDELELEKYRFIMLTLTCKNVTGDELPATLDAMFKAFHRMFRLEKIKDSIAGHFRALEITHDTEKKITKKMYREKKEYYDRQGLKVGDDNPNFDMYHPHFHVMLAVSESYFKKDRGKYISHEGYQAMWKQSLRVEYNPMVNVKAIKNKKGGSVKEAAKYTVKEADYIIKEDKLLTDETVRTLDRALRNRRLVAYGGIMKAIHKRLNLDEEVSADVNIDGEEESVQEESWVIQGYQWNVGFKNYVMVKETEERCGEG